MGTERERWDTRKGNKKIITNIYSRRVSRRYNNNLSGGRRWERRERKRKRER